MLFFLKRRWFLLKLVYLLAVMTFGIKVVAGEIVAQELAYKLAYQVVFDPLKQ